MHLICWKHSSLHNHRSHMKAPTGFPKKDHKFQLKSTPSQGGSGFAEDSLQPLYNDHLPKEAVSTALPVRQPRHWHLVCLRAPLAFFRFSLTKLSLVHFWGYCTTLWQGENTLVYTKVMLKQVLHPPLYFNLVPQIRNAIWSCYWLMWWSILCISLTKGWQWEDICSLGPCEALSEKRSVFGWID